MEYEKFKEQFVEDLKERLALDDDLIRKNPFDFELVNVLVNDSVKRDALSREDERKFLKFVQEDNHYNRYDAK